MKKTETGFRKVDDFLLTLGGGGDGGEDPSYDLVEDLGRVHDHLVVNVAFHEACDLDVACGWGEGAYDEAYDAGEEDEVPASLDLDHGADASGGASVEDVHGDVRGEA